jgi:hypothetical protein
VAKAIIRFEILILALAVLICQTGTAWAASERASATLRLVAVVSPKVKLQVARDTSQIAATVEDLDRGYVEIPNAAELLVWTNSKSGLTITAQVGETLQGAKGHSIPISALSFSVNGEGFRPFVAGDQVVYVGRGQEIRSSKRIDYRLSLDWGTEPDTYAVNITFTVIGN